MNEWSREAANPGTLTRVGVLTMTALALDVLFLQWRFLTSPSERFHAMVPLLWLVDMLWYQRHSTPVRWSYAATFGSLGAVALLVFFLRSVAVVEAKAVGGSTSWGETAYKMSLMASYFVLYTVLASSLNALLKLFPATKALLDAPRGWWLRGLRAGVALGLFAPYIFTTFNVHHFKIGNVQTPETLYHLPYETVSFLADTDGVRLSGWFIPCPHSDATVVVCHGLGVNKSNFLSVVPFLHRGGFNVLMFDFRGHGDSDGHTNSFGVYEARDVKGAVHYLSAQRGSRRIATYAFSMGGAALLHAVGDLPEVRGVVVDSTFADFPALAQSQMAFLPLGLDRPMLAMTNFYGRLESGASLDQVSSSRYVATVSPRPLLIIHGTADVLIPPSHAHDLFAAAREPKELWLIPGAGHCEGLARDPIPYERRVTHFLRQCLSRP